jgi:hypothetical protein
MQDSVKVTCCGFLKLLGFFFPFALASYYSTWELYVLGDARKQSNRTSTDTGCVQGGQLYHRAELGENPRGSSANFQFMPDKKR